LVWIESHEKIELSAADLTRFVAETYNGAVVVAAADGDANQIVVEVTKRAGAMTRAGAEACMSNLKVVQERTDDTVRLSSHLEKPSHADWSTAVSYEAVVPARLALDARTHNGHIEAAGMQGDCSLKTYNGHITVNHLQGNCEARTHNGHIEADGVAGECVLASYNGTIAARADSPMLRAETHNGGVRLAGAPREVNVISYNGSIRADLAEAAELGGRVATYNGGVDLRLGDKTATRLRCSTRNGAVHLVRALDEVTVSRLEMQGRLGESAACLEVETYNGSITIR